MKTVAVLCCHPRSHYKQIAEADCFDAARDCRTFGGGMPAVAHPPCRAWSATCAHQAKPLPGEKDLGPFCVAWLRRCGGVLEHPANSRLFGACDLPRPGEVLGDVWTAEVCQNWWGFDGMKRTWLAFFGIPRESVDFPASVPAPSGCYRRWQLMSKQQRSATPQGMALWLVNCAKLSRVEAVA